VFWCWFFHPPEREDLGSVLGGERAYLLLYRVVVYTNSRHGWKKGYQARGTGKTKLPTFQQHPALNFQNHLTSQRLH